jgi:hypothetical protein
VVCVTLGLVARGLTQLSERPRFKLLVVLGLAAYLVVPAALSASGVLQNFEAFPPPLMLVLIPLLVLTSLAAFSPLGTRVADRYCYASLVALQGFRLPLELVMHHAAQVGVMPTIMSFEWANGGRNFDILTGVLALALWPALRAGKLGRSAVWLWNLLGFGLLANILVIAIRATPTFLHFGPEQENTWVAYVPFVWLPSILVTTALGGQLVLFRKLVRERPTRGAAEASRGTSLAAP